MSDLLLSDPVMRTLVSQITLEELPPAGNTYLSLIEAIVFQQLSVKAARTIFSRFLKLFPESYPHPDELLSMNISHLRGAGLSGQKSAYLQNIARAAKQDNWQQIDWSSMSDRAIIDYLTRIKGVGTWTAQMLLIFSLHRRDVFASGDLGIRQAMQGLFGLKEEGKELQKKMESIAEKWSPDRSLACRYLWRWKDGQY